MNLQGAKTIVTGGAGFIGSHIVDKLIRRGATVIVYDNFSTGDPANLAQWRNSPNAWMITADVLDLDRLRAAMAGVNVVFHFQANADVRGGIHQTRVDLEQNTIATWNVLEAMRMQGAKAIVFASSATVYGEPELFPTPEDVNLRQTSLYGASKRSCEAMIEAYSEYFGFRYDIFRFVSWIGERYSHGVVIDFVDKLQSNPRELNILGDGHQRKSYLHVDDGVSGIFHALDHAPAIRNVFNLGHEEWMNVTDVASIVAGELGLRGVQLNFTGGERGWPGDSPFVHLDIGRMRHLGWRPQISIADGIRRTVRDILDRRAILTESV